MSCSPGNLDVLATMLEDCILKSLEPALTDCAEWSMSLKRGLPVFYPGIKIFSGRRKELGLNWEPECYCVAVW